MVRYCISFVSPKFCIKRIKSALEVNVSLDKSRKIQILEGDDRCLIFTNIQATPCIDDETNIPRDGEQKILAELGLEDLRDIVEFRLLPKADIEHIDKPASRNPVATTVDSWLSDNPYVKQKLTTLHLSHATLLSEFPTSYSIYEPLLLLPNHTFQSSGWQLLLSNIAREGVTELYTALCQKTKTTHIAINAPIPLKTNATASSKPDSSADQQRQQRQENYTLSNVLRSPSGLVPLYGDFQSAVDGSNQTNKPYLTDTDLEQAFWVSTTQNSIKQVWAPLYTMFSRGNVTEKARVLQFPGVDVVAEEKKRSGRRAGAAAVDLYAGIGYFAFSYAKAGFDPVLCWELNPWSVEGMRRGCQANDWNAISCTEDQKASSVDGGGLRSVKIAEAALRNLNQDRKSLLMFNESNECAWQRISALRDKLPPIRHVNLGLLPSSEQSWETAVAVLDPDLGGWLHIHENIAVGAIEQRARQIQARICELVEQEQSIMLSMGDAVEGKKLLGLGLPRKNVDLANVERVKTYAPGIMHCVVDIYIHAKQ